jgi:hypothetical protein
VECRVDAEMRLLNTPVIVKVDDRKPEEIVSSNDY